MYNPIPTPGQSLTGRLVDLLYLDSPTSTSLTKESSEKIEHHIRLVNINDPPPFSHPDPGTIPYHEIDG